MDFMSKCRRHTASYRDFRPVVFCVQCGSTRLDQNSVTELRCYDCGNTLPWDGSKFGIRRRPEYTEDVTRALWNAGEKSAKDRIN